MKLIKKIIICISVSFVTLGLFAQNADYQKHFEKAKEYESQKKWVNALGEYYDAMVAKPSFEAVEAFNSYKQLSDVIENGNPGYGEYDEFEFYDAWIDMMKEYERYWSENPPRYFDVKIKRDSLNRENRTATYSTWVESNLLKKYVEFEKLFKTGAQKAYKDDWSKCLKEWPRKSVWNAEKSGLLENNTPLVQSSEWTEPYSSFNSNSLGKDEKACAATTRLNGVTDVWLYDLKYSILTDDGTVIFDSKRQILNDADYKGMGKTTAVQFTVPQNTMKLLDSGNYKTAFKDIHLEYGKIEIQPFCYDYWENGKRIKIEEEQRERFWLKKLPEVEVKLENIRTEKDSINKYSEDFLYLLREQGYNSNDGNVLLIIKQFSELKPYLNTILASKQIENELYKIYIATKRDYRYFDNYTIENIKNLFEHTRLLQSDDEKFAPYWLSDILNIYENLQPCYEDIYEDETKRERVVNENGWYVLIEEKEIKKPGYSPESEYYYYLVRKNNLATE